MADSTPVLSANFRDRVVKLGALRLSDAVSRSTTDYAEVIVGDGAPSGAYGRNSGASMLYLRKDAGSAHDVLYVTGNGGTVWAQADAPEIVDVTIANAQVRTMNGTPVEVIPAPGAGKAVVVESVQWWLDYGSAAFDGSAAGEDLVLTYTDGSGAEVVDVVDHSGFADATSDQYRFVRGVSVTPVANAAIMAFIKAGEWYAAAGDSDLKARIRFRTIDLTW